MGLTCSASRHVWFQNIPLLVTAVHLQCEVPASAVRVLMHMQAALELCGTPFLSNPLLSRARGGGGGGLVL